MAERPLNKCFDCKWQWHPKGHDLSRCCPHCGSRRVALASSFWPPPQPAAQSHTAKAAEPGATPQALLGCLGIATAAFLLTCMGCIALIKDDSGSRNTRPRGTVDVSAIVKESEPPVPAPEKKDATGQEPVGKKEQPPAQPDPPAATPPQDKPKEKQPELPPALPAVTVWREAAARLGRQVRVEGKATMWISKGSLIVYFRREDRRNMIFAEIDPVPRDLRDRLTGKPTHWDALVEGRVARIESGTVVMEGAAVLEMKPSPEPEVKPDGP